MNAKSLLVCLSVLNTALLHTSHAQNTEALVAEGRASLVASNLVVAKARFEAAVAQSPNHETANALLGVTRLLALVNEPGISNFLSSAGFPVEGRNMYA